MPYIRQVLDTKSALTTEPGHMQSCDGCRFRGNCPSAMEIFKCIICEDVPIGVLALTSFSKNVYESMVADKLRYEQLADKIMAMITSLPLRYNADGSSISEAKLLSAIELSEDAYILVDRLGRIEAVNTPALELFSFCGMSVNNLGQFFPDNTVSVILSGQNLVNFKVKLNKASMRIFSTAVQNSGRVIGTALRIVREALPPESSAVRQSIQSVSDWEIKGGSSHILSIKKKIAKVADSPSTIFISGETGTGKSLLAKVIHASGKRQNKPFVMVNCTSIPESLFESELFGYEAGAFTGAKREGKPGKFELADGGTLFLDEVSEIPFNMQAKLLSVLQESTFERVGGIAPIRTDVRIIAASNRKLREMVDGGSFRSDLFYRLNVIPIELIPLRERPEDILTLAEDFLLRYNKKLDRSITSFDEAVAGMLRRYSWPGNIRQLENTVEYCVNMCEGSTITCQDLPLDLTESMSHDQNANSGKLRDSEYRLIIETVNKYGWTVRGKTLAAKELGIGLRTLYRKLENT